MSFKKIGDGFYENEQGELHVSIPELLDYYGYPDTEGNREMMTNNMARVFGEILPNTTTIITD